MTILHTATALNTMVATLKTLILTNKANLGLSSISEVFERDESPAVALENGNVPSIYIVPLAEGGDNMNSSIGSQEVWHEFPITIYAYYRLDEVPNGLVTTRNYGYNLVDYLWGDGIKGTEANILKQKLDVGYYVMVDNIIHYFILRLTIRSLIQPD